MSLIRQIRLLLVFTVLLAFVGSALLTTLGARGAIEAQLRLKNSDNAAAYAAVLSTQHGDPVLLQTLLSAQFDTGFYRRIRLVGADGRVLFLRAAAGSRGSAPAWFAALLPIDSIPGRAQVSDGWRALGTLEVVSHTAFAEDELWTSTVRAGAALLALALLLAWPAAAVVRRVQIPLDRTVMQAQRLLDGEFVVVDEPSSPELRRVAQAMNTLVRRLKLNFEVQAHQTEALRLQATADPLTGLANRKHFMAQLQTQLEREDAPLESGLVLVRLRDLAGTNRQIGHAATDRMICALAQALATYREHIAGCHVGRLNGADFALALPVGGLAGETGRALAEALRALLPNFGPGVGAALGAVEFSRGTRLTEVMGTADGALALAEAAPPFSVEVVGAAAENVSFGGEGSWRPMLQQALAGAGARLASYPLITSTRQLVHLECPLRLQLQPPGGHEPAARWLPLALRTGLTPSVDERAVTLALTAIGADALPRCANISTASLRDSGFVPRLKALVQEHPQAARALYLEVPEQAAVEQFDAVQGLGRELRPLGVRFGLEHAGERLARIERLFEAGLDYAKLDAAVVVGLHDDPQRITFVAGIVAMLHGLAMQVYAEGVADADDALALWRCGVDGVTGPWASGERGDLLG